MSTYSIGHKTKKKKGTVVSFHHQIIVITADDLLFFLIHTLVFYNKKCQNRIKILKKNASCRGDSEVNDTNRVD